MTKVLKIKKGVEEGVQELLKHLVESGKVKGVLTLKKLSENKSGDAVAYSLITSKDLAGEATPLYPVMPRNAGGLVSLFTQKGEVPEPVAIVLRPCELRALVELVKRNRGNLKNLFIISSTCGGVYPTEMSVTGELEKELPKYWDSIKKNDIATGIRNVCQGCVEFVPYNADMTVAVVGGGGGDCEIYLNSDKAEEFAKGANGQVEDKEMPNIDGVREKRATARDKIYKDQDLGSLNIEGMVKVFGKCIGCRGCRTACPICYCELCTFDSESTQYKIPEKELDRKGAVRIPPGTVYYQMTRLPHVTISCVGCGSCEDACPVGIPLGTIFKKVGEDVQGVFDYVPGKDVAEEIPIKTFELDEYTEVED